LRSTVAPVTRAWSQALWWGLTAAVVVVAVFVWRPPRFFGPDCDELGETMIETLRSDSPASAAALAEWRDADCGEP
jgi:hypothetical protein